MDVIAHETSEQLPRALGDAVVAGKDLPHAGDSGIFQNRAE
jgi:hypothetical protein